MPQNDGGVSGPWTSSSERQMRNSERPYSKPSEKRMSRLFLTLCAEPA